ncbi:hypothetical protein C5C28_14955 [Rathayibacter rathayi]|nr:hypothetical protein C5C28_14955 [Rathayibacter rathayi]
MAGYASYQYPDIAPVSIPVTVASAGATVLGFGASQFAARRAKLRERITSFLATEFGSSWNPATDFTASKWRDGTPRRIRLDYPAGLPDHDNEWRARIEELVRLRMQADQIHATWQPKRSRVTLEGRDSTASALDRARSGVEDRITLILRPVFRVELRVTVSKWSTTDDLLPERIELKYGITSQDGSDLWRRRVEATAGLKLGGRWRARFDPTSDSGVLEPRPELPKSVVHPGASLYDEYDPKSPTLFYGIDENGTPRGWKIGRRTTMPHMLCIGPTGGGKTTVLRSLISGMVDQGGYVMACDPKMIELTPFYGFPGIYVASTPAEMAVMIDSMDALMYERYNKIKANPSSVDLMRPVLFVLDELLILRQVLKRYHAQEKGTGTPPSFDKIAGMLALARTAQINIVIGVQRPDASLFDDGSRDNLRQRLSLMRLSPQGSGMLWGTPYVGVDLPMVQGRAMASPDGDNPIEMQTYWIADPLTATGADLEVIESIRARAIERLAGIEPPIDVTPFINDAPRLDLETLPKSPADLLLGASDYLEETDAAGQGALAFDTQDVAADTLIEDDRIILESGDIGVITAVEEDPFDDDCVNLTIRQPNGEEESMSVTSSDYLPRVLDLGEDA